MKRDVDIPLTVTQTFRLLGCKFRIYSNHQFGPSADHSCVLKALIPSQQATESILDRRALQNDMLWVRKEQQNKGEERRERRREIYCSSFIDLRGRGQAICEWHSYSTKNSVLLYLKRYWCWLRRRPSCLI